MKNATIFMICMVLVLSLGSMGVNSFAQNTNQVNQTGENAQGAVNETGEALSNATGGIFEGLKDLVNGSSP
jgi:hypothetical protein